MVHQLILNTLMACQPKVPASTSSVVDAKQVPESNGTNSRSGDDTRKDSWPSVLPDPVGFEGLHPVKPTSDALQFYASEVSLRDLSDYEIGYYDQYSKNPQHYLCKEMCALHPEVTNSSFNMYDIENCRMDLIDNWKEVVVAVQEQGRDKLLPQLDVQVGVVECNGSLVHVQFGRAATTPAQYEALDDDWGGYFARLAQEEATAVFAFGELLEHLNRWEAPESLQDWCGQIIDEEQTHALMMSGLAHRNGQKSACIQFPSVNQVSMKEMAIHNALTGCIGETWSAVLLRYQSEHAPKYNGVFKRIAKDETSHAEFSWVLHEWLMSKLSEDEQTEVLESMKELLSNPPEYRCVTQIGEMSSETFGRAWNSFSEQLRTVLVP